MVQLMFVRPLVTQLKKVVKSCSTKTNRTCSLTFVKNCWKMSAETDDFERCLKTTNQLKSTPTFKKVMENEELRKLKEICDRNNMDIRMAGGPVRDILLKQVPHDLDFATTKTPDQMKQIFNKEEIRMIEYGQRAIEHGTVTVRINDKENYEITTTRSDVLTNGRHAKVEFHQDWGKDASRRDLTINAMFLDLNGKLYDYFNGVEHLEERKILFVGKAADRIQEDYLRIMRYFRFFGRICKPDDEHCKDTLNTIKENASGLQGVAGERIWYELKKIMRGEFADNIIGVMKDYGVFKYIGLPEHCELDKFQSVFNLVKNEKPTEITLLSALMSDKHDVDDFHKRLKLSRKELANMTYIVENRAEFKSEIKRYKDEICVSKDLKFIKLSCIELAKYCGNPTMAKELSEFEPPKYPFSAKHLLNMGLKGKEISQVNDELRKVWMDYNYKTTEEKLMEEAEKLVEKLRQTDSTDSKSDPNDSKSDLNRKSSRKRPHNPNEWKSIPTDIKAH